MSRFFVYPAVLCKCEEVYSLKLPDFVGTVIRGEDKMDVIRNGKVNLESIIIKYLVESKKLPEPTDMSNIVLDSDSTLVFISCDVIDLKKDSKYVKKTLTLPSWINDLAEKRGLNFSQILREALLYEMGLNG